MIYCVSLGVPPSNRRRRPSTSALRAADTSLSRPSAVAGCRGSHVALRGRGACAGENPQMPVDSSITRVGGPPDAAPRAVTWA